MTASQIPAASFVSTVAPRDLTLQQTITSGTTVTIPAGINWVWAVCVSGGWGGQAGFTAVTGGKAGGGPGVMISGWVPASSTCVIGPGGTGGTTSSALGNPGGATIYSTLVASNATNAFYDGTNAVGAAALTIRHHGGTGGQPTLTGGNAAVPHSVMYGLAGSIGLTAGSVTAGAAGIAGGNGFYAGFGGGGGGNNPGAGGAGGNGGNGTHSGGGGGGGAGTAGNAGGAGGSGGAGLICGGGGSGGDGNNAISGGAGGGGAGLIGAGASGTAGTGGTGTGSPGAGGALGFGGVGGGAGTAAATATTTGGVGGAGGAGGGGGGAGANAGLTLGAGGAGGAGCILLYY